MLTLLEHPHLFDGGLARAMAYMALALVMGQLYWLQHLPRWPAWPWLVWALGTLGMLLGLHSVWLALSPELSPQNAQPDSLASEISLLDLLSTHFALAWVLYCLCLGLAVWLLWLLWLLWRKSQLSLIPITLMLLSLVWTAHAGEAGPGYAVFWLDALHMGLALWWLGSVSLLLLIRLGAPASRDYAHIGLHDLQQFSRLALPVFLAILLSGAGRLWFTWEESAGLEFSYAVMLGLKLAAVLGVVVSAWSLRKQLKRAPFASEQYDRGLSTEYFFALLLLLFTSLLTQLTPG